jgi:hypothetical protein
MQSLAPSEYFPGIKFNYSFYTTGETKVALEYVNNNFLKCTGYAYSRAISTSFNGIIYALGGIQGSGAGLTNLNTYSKQATLTGTSVVNVSDLTTTLLTTTKMNGVKNTSYLTSFQNICSSTNFIKTTGLDPSTNKIVYTTTGIYQLYASSVGSSNIKIENIFDDNATTSWTTPTNSYLRSVVGASYAHSTYSINVINLGLVYGEWIKIRFPRKCYIQDVLYTPFSLPTSITEGYIIGSNDEFDWEPVYPISKTLTNLSEISLINVGGFLPLIYSGTSKSFKYFIFIATRIQGTAGANIGSTEKLVMINLRFILYDSWVYHDNIISVGTFPLGDPVSNALDINDNAYVSGQIISEGGLNVLSGTSTLTGRVGIEKAPHTTYSLDVLGDVNVSGAFRINGTSLTNSWSTSGTSIYYNGGNVGIGNSTPTWTLCLGNSQVSGSDGFLLIGKNNGSGGARTQRIGYNANFDLTIGDYGGGTGPWVEAFKLSYTAPANSLVVAGNGYVGMGVSPAYRTQIKLSYDNVTTGLHLDTSDDTNPNKYALTIWAYVIAGGEVGYRFRTQNYSGGTYTPLTINNYGNVVVQNNLSTGSLYSTTSIQASGSFYFQPNVWNRDNDNNLRFYFGGSSTSYWRGNFQATCSPSHEWRLGLNQ